MTWPAQRPGSRAQIPHLRHVSHVGVSIVLDFLAPYPGGTAARDLHALRPGQLKLHHLFRLILPLLLTWVQLLTGQTNLQTNAAPFLNFRQGANSKADSDLEDMFPTNVAEVCFGWFGPSTPGDSLGGQLWCGADLAIREANAQGGCEGRPFRLIPKWSENPWGNGVPQIFRMVYEDQVRALLGGIDGASTHLAEQVVAKTRLPLISPASTDASVNLAGVPWMFSCAPSDRAMAPLLAEAILRPLKEPGDRLAVFSATDHDSRATAKELLKALAERHRTPDFHFEFPAGEQSFESQLSGIAGAKPGAILVIASPEDSARLVMAVRRRSGDTAIFATHQAGRSRFRQLAGNAAEGVRFPLLWVPDKSDAVTRKFIADFKARFAREPDYAAALSYDATRLLVAAARQGGPSRARIREALRQLSPFRGIAGLIQWDATGQNVREVRRMGVIRKGQIEPEPL